MSIELGNDNEHKGEWQAARAVVFPNIGHKGSNIEKTIVEYEQLKQLQEKKRQAKLAKQQAKNKPDIENQWLIQMNPAMTRRQFFSINYFCQMVMLFRSAVLPNFFIC